MKFKGFFGRSVFARILAVAGLALLLVGCGEMGFGNWSWHQKMTVVIETPEGEKTGSAVTSILWWPNTFSGGWGGASWHSEVHGEAVVVDLGKGRYLFALLSYSNHSEYIENLATQSLYDTTNRQWTDEAFEKVVKRKTPIVVPAKLYPLLVTFTDINDPKTVQKINPDDLTSSFGPGYRLKGLTLEITDEAVTRGEVEKVLGWLDTVKGRIKPYSGPPRNLGDVPDVELLDKFDFKKGDN